MRYIRYACIATFAVALFAVALANRKGREAGITDIAHFLGVPVQTITK